MKLLTALASLCLFPLTCRMDIQLSTPHCMNSCFLHLVDCWTCLPGVKFIMGHGNLSIPWGILAKFLMEIGSTRDPRLGTVMYRIRTAHFPTKENYNASSLILPLATEGEHELKLGGWIGIKASQHFIKDPPKSEFQLPIWAQILTCYLKKGRRIHLTGTGIGMDVDGIHWVYDWKTFP